MGVSFQEPTKRQEVSTITAAQAKELALEWVQKQRVGEGDECVLVERSTMERPFGWVFFYGSKRYIETGESRYALAGNAPVVVTRVDGRIHHTGTAFPIEHYLEKFKDYGPRR
jgi:hypothetical protein